MRPPASPTLLLTWLRNGWRLLLSVGSLLGGGALVLGLVVFTAYRHGVFERQLHISVKVPDAQGLRPGSRVILSGVPVGALRQLEVQGDGRVLLKLRVPFRYRGVVSPASSVSIAQDYLMGDQELNLRPAPAPASSVPDRFEVPYRGAGSLEDLLAGVQSTLAQLERLLVTGERLGQGELPRTLQQLQTSLRQAEALTGSLQREVPPTAAVLRQTGREAGSTAREARSTLREAGSTLREAGSTVREVRLASSELVRTLVQVRPALSRALLQVDDTGEQAQTALIWLNQLIDRLDPGYRLRRQGPQPRPDAMAPESGPPAVPAPAAPSQSATP